MSLAAKPHAIEDFHTTVIVRRVGAVRRKITSEKLGMQAGETVGSGAFSPPNQPYSLCSQDSKQANPNK